LLAGIALLFLLNWRLATVALLIFPIAFIGPRVIAPRAVEASYTLKNREAAALGSIHEQIGAITVIKAFGLRGIATNWFRAHNRDVAAAMQRATFLNTMVERSVTIAVLLLHLVVLASGAVFAFRGLISVGTFVTFESVFWEVSYNLAHVLQFLPVLIGGSGAVRHMQDLLDEPLTIVDRPGAGELARMRKSVTFEKVCFSYGGAEGRHLDRLDLAIPAGSRVAIVGPSGAGKTTVLGLLLRLYEPQAGRITIDGVDVGSVTLDSLRAQLAVVFQENVLFQGTLRENIRLGKPDGSDEEVVAAAKKAEIHRFIRSLPRGYDTLVGERGATLSGGQRQRIAIARAILRDPAILLLDEATSALDQTTEAAINRTLRGIGAGRTVIFVTHRLTAVTQMDEILVLDRGRLVQRGTHDQLLAKKGLYASLWKAQARGKGR
jgi:ATP-binding cassette subfamily B protein